MHKGVGFYTILSFLTHYSFYCPGSEISWHSRTDGIASLADFRQPDVTLESGLVLNICGQL